MLYILRYCLYTSWKGCPSGAHNCFLYSLSTSWMILDDTRGYPLVSYYSFCRYSNLSFRCTCIWYHRIYSGMHQKPLHNSVCLRDPFQPPLGYFKKAHIVLSSSTFVGTWTKEQSLKCQVSRISEIALQQMICRLSISVALVGVTRVGFVILAKTSWWKDMSTRARHGSK